MTAGDAVRVGVAQRIALVWAARALVAQALWRVAAKPATRLADEYLDTMEEAGNAVKCDADPQLSRAERAKQAYKPSTKAKQVLAEENERLVARGLSGNQLPDNEAMDVLAETADGRLVGVEVKSLIDNGNDKITMHPKSRRRKEAWAQDNGADVYTVVIDSREATRPAQYSGCKYYAREGAGAFRVSSMRCFESLEAIARWIGIG